MTVARAVRAARAAIGVALLPALAGGCVFTLRPVPRDALLDVVSYQGDAARAGTASEVVDTAPSRTWAVRLGRGTLGMPAIGDRVGVVATVDRWVYAFDMRTGRTYWRHRADAPFGPAGVLAGGGRVYAASEGNLGRVVAVDLRTGRRRWTARVGDVAAPMVLAGEVLYGVTSAGSAFAHRTSDGRPVWTREVGPARSSPILLGDRIAIVTLRDTLVTLDRATGRIVAQATLPSSAVAPPTRLDDSTIVVPSPDGALLAVAVPGGAVRWRVATGEPVAGAAVVARDTVWALTTGCLLWRVPLATPAQADSSRIDCVTETGPTVVSRGVLVATVGGEVIYYDAAARRRVWTRQVRGPLRQPPVVRRGQIVLAPTLGDVVSFR